MRLALAQEVSEDDLRGLSDNQCRWLAAYIEGGFDWDKACEAAQIHVSTAYRWKAQSTVFAKGVAAARAVMFQRLLSHAYSRAMAKDDPQGHQLLRRLLEAYGEREHWRPHLRADDGGASGVTVRLEIVSEDGKRVEPAI
jgi:hypothetical protein